MNNKNLFYNLRCLSQYSKQIEQGNLIDFKIISNTFYIPYLYCQGSYNDIDVSFDIEIFYDEIKILECNLEFTLFDDNNDENKLKNMLWKSTYIHNKYIEHYFNNVECKECYILDEKLVIIFEIDLTINGYQYELMYGEGTYDYENDKIIDDIYEVYNIRDDDDEGEMWNKKLLYIGDFTSSKNFVKKWLYENKQNNYKYGIYYDSIYFTKNKKNIYHMFNNNYESYLTYEKHYDMILDDEKIFTEWKYI
jgi:hypothetical protein